MFLALTKTSPHGMFLLNQERMIVAANERLQDLLGYPSIAGFTFVQLLDDPKAGDEDIIPLGSSVVMLKSHSGRRIPAQLTAWELAQESPYYICVMVQTQGLLPDLRRITLHDVTISISKDSQLEDLLTLLLVNLNHFINHDAANVMLLQADGRWKVVAHRGYDKMGVQQWLDHAQFDGSEFPHWSQMMASARPHFVSDTHLYPSWTPRSAVAWVRSMANLPILLEGQIVGYINLESTQPNFFHEGHLDYLRFFGHQASTILKNMNILVAERQQRQLLEALYHSATALSSTLEMPELIRNILSNLKSVVPFEAASIMMIDDNILRVIGQQGYEAFTGGEAVATVSIYLEKGSPWWQFCNSTEPLIVPDTLNDPTWIVFPGVEWVRSHIHMPLLVKGEVVGILNLDSSTSHYFTRQHLEQLQFFVAYIATAIQNARTFSTEREQRQFAEVLNSTVMALEHLTDFDDLMTNLFDNLVKVIPYDAANVFLLQDGLLRVVYQRGWEYYKQDANWWSNLALTPDQYKLWAVQLKHPEPRIIYDTLTDEYWETSSEAEWVRSHINVPILADGRLIGSINLDSAKPNTFTNKHAQFFKPFSYYTSIAIKNARLFAAERDQHLLAQALLDNSQALNSTLHLQEVMQRILENIQRIVPHDASNIMLVEGDTLYIISHQGYEPFGIAEWVGTVSFSLTPDSMWQQKLDTKTANLVGDTYNIEGWSLSDHTRWIRAHVDIPLIVDEQVIGLINLDHALPHHFGWSDVEKLMPFVSQAELAIKNARLFTQEREQRQLAQALRDSGEALNSTLNLSEIMQRILDNIGRIVPHSTSNIMLLQGNVLRVITQRGYERFGLVDWLLNFETLMTPDSRWYYRMTVTEPDIISDAHVSPDWINIPQTAWVRSHLAIPLRLEDQAIGFINLDSDQPNQFSRRDLEKLRPFVHQAEIAIRNARLFAQEQEQRRMTQALYATTAALNQSFTLKGVFDHLLENVKLLIPYDAANVMVIEDEVAHFEAWRGYEAINQDSYMQTARLPIQNDPNIQEVFAEKIPILIDDPVTLDSWFADTDHVGWLKAHIKAPILLDNEVVGLLNLDATRPNSFTQQHLLQVVPFTVHAATALRNAQLYEDLEHERSYLRAILDGSADGIMYTENTKIVYANDALCEMLGYTQAELLAIPLTRLRNRRAKFNPMYAGQTSDMQAHNSRLYGHQDVQFFHKDGSLVDITLTMTRLSLDHERPIRTVLIARDVRQEKRLLQLQNRFMVHAAHELRHPIANISTRLYLLTKMPQNLEKHVAVLQESVDRLTTLTEHMTIMMELNLGRLKLQRGMVLLRQLLGSLLEENNRNAQAKHVSWSLDWDIPNDYLMLDPTLVKILVRLLLTDAILNTPSQSSLNIRFSLLGPNLLLQIQDGRPSIPQHELDQFSQPFFVPSEGGVIHSGLELAIVKHIVELYQGTLKVQNAAEHGVIFQIKLPLG